MKTKNGVNLYGPTIEEHMEDNRRAIAQYQAMKDRDNDPRANRIIQEHRIKREDEIKKIPRAPDLNWRAWIYLPLMWAGGFIMGLVVRGQF